MRPIPKFGLTAVPKFGHEQPVGNLLPVQLVPVDLETSNQLLATSGLVYRVKIRQTVGIGWNPLMGHVGKKCV